MRTRLREAWEFARFAYQTLTAPWPPFAALLVVTSVVGGLTPLILIRATAGLVDTLTARRGIPPGPGASWLDLLRPYLPWLLLFIGMRIVNWLITMDSYQRYLSAVGAFSGRWLEDGRIVEEGTQAELMARHGRYAELVTIQASWYQ